MLDICQTEEDVDEVMNEVSRRRDEGDPFTGSYEDGVENAIAWITGCYGMNVRAEFTPFDLKLSDDE